MRIVEATRMLVGALVVGQPTGMTPTITRMRRTGIPRDRSAGRRRLFAAAGGSTAA